MWPTTHLWLQSTHTLDRRPYRQSDPRISTGRDPQPQYLIRLGHRRIGFITGRPDLESARHREQGYLRALELAGIPDDPTLVRVGDYTREGTEKPARDLLQMNEPPTAIFAANDVSAIALIEVARSLGVNVPDDLSVIGFDNVPESALVESPTDHHQSIHSADGLRGNEVVDRAHRRSRSGPSPPDIANRVGGPAFMPGHLCLSEPGGDIDYEHRRSENVFNTTIGLREHPKSMGRRKHVNRILRKPFALLAVLLLVVAACGGGGAVDETTTTAEPAETTTTGAEATTTTEAQAEPVTIEWWHIQNTDPMMALWQDMANEFMEAHPNVTINVTVMENEAFKAALQTNMQAGDVPDLFQSWGGGGLREQVEAGLVQDITDLSSGFIGNLNEGAVGLYQVDGIQYGIPFNLGMVGFWYNKDLFAQAGIDAPPATWDEFLEDVQALKDAGITPIAVGAGDKWPAHFYYSYLMIREGGQAAMDQVTTDLNFDVPAFVEAGNQLQRLIDLEPFQPGFLAAKWDAPDGESGTIGTGLLRSASWVSGDPGPMPTSPA